MIPYFNSNDHFENLHEEEQISSDSDSSDDQEVNEIHPSPTNTEVRSELYTPEDFATWQRIIRLDAVRANEEWTDYSPVQATISNERAHRAAKAVGLKDYDQLEPFRIFHAARLTAILEAYAIYDPEIGYCQGMCDLLSPIIAVIIEDHDAFWCFFGFMKKARHIFRLDELGIMRQLVFISRIIQLNDSHLYRHLEKPEAEDCFFVYRMVVVLFRRELSFDQTICLWEAMWANQAAIRAGIGKSSWNKMLESLV
ncbi:rab GTPase-activating protein 22-like [Impatiens glandulifera]|uniref:rab GTPase-activating protein 22-like n=1 Tax=Impatiens glandulifera TaxID=253017 RepID=UPI001FB10123|nr:rab GTPase-activating protein 22-like [Impatiens glandulifera]